MLTRLPAPAGRMNPGPTAPFSFSLSDRAPRERWRSPAGVFGAFAVLALALLLVAAGSAAAAPSITSTFLFTDNRQNNDVGVSQGHRLVLSAFVSDPL